MSSREEVARGTLVYSCNCGWLERGHANPSAGRPDEWVEALWRQLRTEGGIASVKPGASGFKVTSSKDPGRRRATAGSVISGTPLSRAPARGYFVARDLDVRQKETVALAIFLEVVAGFETPEGSFPWTWAASRSRDASDGGLGEHDLVPDLIGLYLAVRPGLRLRPADLCKPVSKQASLAVWDAGWPATGREIHGRSVSLHPCDECRGAERFSAAFQQIVPAKKGTLFRDWTTGTGGTDEIVSSPELV